MRFRPDHSNIDHISLFSKILINIGIGSMLNTSRHVLLISRKHTTGFLVKSFGECCVSTVLTAACYQPSSHCMPAQKFVFVSGELNHDRSQLVLQSDKGVCCHRSFSKLTSVVLNLFAEGRQIRPTILLESPTKFFNAIQFTRFVLQQNDVCYTKYWTFCWKTWEGPTGAWESNAALGTGVENHWSTWIG